MQTKYTLKWALPSILLLSITVFLAHVLRKATGEIFLCRPLLLLNKDERKGKQEITRNTTSTTVRIAYKDIV